MALDLTDAPEGYTPVRASRTIPGEGGCVRCAFFTIGHYNCPRYHHCTASLRRDGCYVYFIKTEPIPQEGVPRGAWALLK